MSSTRTERTPWYASIVTRITLVMAFLLLVAMGITGWIGYQASRDELIAKARADMRHTLDVAAARMQAYNDALREDIDFLAGSEAVGLWSARMDTDTVAARPLPHPIKMRRPSGKRADTTGINVRVQAIERVTRLFDPFIRSRSMYAQVRLIAADSAGNEVVRFDREGDRITHAADSLLQPKGERDYYKATMALPPAGRYFSKIDLNKEHGVIVRPLMPTLRASAPVISPQGKRAGIVIINTDMRPFFKELAALADSGRALMLAGADGELLLHPDTSRVFRFEFGGSSRLSQATEPAANSLPPDHAEALNDQVLAETHDIIIGPGNDRYTLAITQPLGGLLAELHARRDELAKVLGLVAGGAILLALIYALGLRARLNRLTKRMERYAIGEHEEIPIRRRDEVGRMARGFTRMQQRIDERVKDLETARASAEASDRQRRELLANMSHEVRTPLNAIIGLTSDLDTAPLKEAEREKIHIVQRSASRLKGLVDDLLMHARIGEGKLAVNVTAVNVRTLINDILLAHKPAAKAKGLELTAALDGLPEHVGSDALRLHQIVDNLVGNAVRFTAHGSVTISARADGSTLHIDVADTGPGIAESEQLRVFERFERATTSEQEQGTGLGLAITKRVVDLLGGRIELQSELGRGSRFLVRVPVTPAVAPAPVSVATPAFDTSGLKVLYVEDVATNRMLVQEWATGWRWKLIMVENGERAIEACEREIFDLLLIDLGLGQGMSGAELALKLRVSKRHRYTPMIAITAFAEEGDDADALKAGMNDRVTKPIDKSHLLKSCAFWTERAPRLEEEPDLATLNAQYDGDREKLLKVYQQYRREFTQHRLLLRDALVRGDQDLLSATRHKLRPHWQLLKLHAAVQHLDALHATSPNGRSEAMEEIFRAFDRALMHAQRELFTASAGG